MAEPIAAHERAVAALIDSQPVAFLGSVDPDGFPEIKGMFQPRKRDGLRTLYFPTNIETRRVAHFRHDPRAVVYIGDLERIEGVQLQGHVEILTDHETKAAVWREGDALYYPGGVDDPLYCVLKVTIFQGRLYTVKSGSQDFIVT